MLKIAIEIGVRDCFPVTDDYGKAIKYDEKRLKIAKEMGYKAGEGAFTKLSFLVFKVLEVSDVSFCLSVFFFSRGI